MVSPGLQAALASFGAIIGILSILVLWKLRNKDQTAMVRLRLMPEKTVRDFQIFTLGNAIMFIGYLSYLTGLIVDNESMLDAARLIGLVYGVFVTVVFFRWWRRL